MAITTTSTLPAPVQQAFNEKLLSVRVPHLIHALPAMRYNKERNSGPIERFRRYDKLATAKAPLGKTGITPPSATLTAIDIDAEVNFYGNWVAINEQVTLFAQDKPLNEAALLLGINLRETEDELVRDMLASTASAINCTEGVNGDRPTEITRSDIDGVVTTLLGNDAKAIFENIEAQDRFGSGPVRNSFMALCSTDLCTDLQAVDGFLNTAQYPSQNNILQAEFGTAGQLRFMVSSIGSKSTAASDSGNDVYNVLCVGQEAFGIIDQDGANPEFIYLGPEFSGPLALNSTAGWKTAFAQAILNDLWILNLRCTVA